MDYDDLLGAVLESFEEVAETENALKSAQDEDVIFGSGYAHGLDVLGGAALKKKPPRAGFVKTKTPAGRTMTSLVVKKPKLGDYKTSIKNAQDVGKRAVALGQKFKAALAAAGHKTVKTVK